MTKKKFQVLITGCSTGIGRALANAFRTEGHGVVASARRQDSLDELAGAGFDTVRLDVNDSESIAQAVPMAIERLGYLDMLVNNAGLGRFGPAAEQPLDDIRLQMETNAIAPTALLQAIFPHMAERKEGRVVMVGSISGILTTPFGAAYCASKAAIRSLTDAARIELQPFGINVVEVRAGGVKSEFGDGSPLGPESRYRPWEESIRRRVSMSQDRPWPTDRFARSLVRAVTGRTAPRVVRLGRGARLAPFLKAIFPDWLLDRILARRFGLTRQG